VRSGINHWVDPRAGARLAFNRMANTQAAGLDAIFHALSDPTRRAILRDVSRRAKTVTEVARPYRMSLAAVSKHLKVLEAAELIGREKRGSFQVISLSADPMKKAQGWLAYYEKFWNQRLDRLQAMLEGKADE
jgi:DNA-binding transcriptional ArsR family regulator